MGNKTVKVYGVIHGAKDIEDILCLSVLIASDKISETSTLEDSRLHYELLGEDCDNCPCVKKCLASIVNQ